MEQGSLSALWRQGKSTSDLCQSVYRLRLNRLPYESHQYAYGLKFEPSKVRHHSNTNDNIDDEVVETIENWLLTESQLIEALEVHRLARLSTIERVLVCEMHRQGKRT